MRLSNRFSFFFICCWYYCYFFLLFICCTATDGWLCRGGNHMFDQKCILLCSLQVKYLRMQPVWHVVLVTRYFTCRLKQKIGHQLKCVTSRKKTIEIHVREKKNKILCKIIKQSWANTRACFISVGSWTPSTSSSSSSSSSSL